ncbi:MAG: 50S ribosomal protein L3 [Patescibacteria group bacterium]
MIAFAKKIGMTRLFLDGKAVPCTVIQVQDSVVTQTKTVKSDGYNAIQLASCAKNNSTKAKLGHSKKAGQESDFKFISEFKDIEITEDKTSFDVNDFAIDDNLSVISTTIGKGFAGAVKRWGFHGQPKSHGHDHVRAVGSIGSRWPQRVPKGKKMAGHLGARQMTLNGVKILAVDPENKLLFVNGSLPGANSVFMKIQKINK